MIELTYICHDCGVHLSRWVTSDSDPEEIDECIFCGGDNAEVFMSDDDSDDSESDELIMTMMFGIRAALYEFVQKEI